MICNGSLLEVDVATLDTKAGSEMLQAILPV
jgi:hypothetical protein